MGGPDLATRDRGRKRFQVRTKKKGAELACSAPFSSNRGGRPSAEVLAVAELQLGAVEAVRVLVHQDLVGEGRTLLADQRGPVQEEVPEAEPLLAVGLDHVLAV